MIRYLFFFLVMMVVASASWTRADDLPDAFDELTSTETFGEIMRHVYRWYLDEEDFDGVLNGDSLTYYLHIPSIRLDEGDQSLYADLIVPSVGALVRMKKTDYRIEELDLDVKSDRFKINLVESIPADAPLPEGAHRLEVSLKTMMDKLFQTRRTTVPLSEDLRSRLRQAIRHEILSRLDTLPDTGSQVVFIAPVSPNANEVWVYWQNAHLLIRWASDIELTNPAVWDHETLTAKVIDIEEQVVLSFQEAPGSNAYMTRDQVGRILYNCAVLGECRVISRAELKANIKEEP